MSRLVLSLTFVFTQDFQFCPFYAGFFKVQMAEGLTLEEGPLSVSLWSNVLSFETKIAYPRPWHFVSYIFLVIVYWDSLATGDIEM